MARFKPKKIDYMDMTIPFDSIKMPKAKKEQEKFVKRFEAEFGEDYRLSPWIDPCGAVDEDGTHIFKHGSLEEKLERIHMRKYLIKRLERAVRNDDEEEINFYNSFRDLPALPGSDNGWNATVLDKTHKRRMNSDE